MNFRSRSWRKTGDLQLELTPLIDVIFLLLLFFLITTTFVYHTQQETAIIISLSKGKMGVSVKETKKVTITITKEGNFFINDENMTFEELEARMNQLHEETPDAVVVVRADELTYHRDFSRVLDMVREIGFEAIGVGMIEDE